MIGQGVKQLLAEQTGDVLPGGIWPVGFPDTPKLPAATYKRVSYVPQYTMDGSLGAVTSRLQIDIFATKADECAAAAAAIRQVLDGYTGRLPNGVVLENAWQADENDSYDPTARQYRVQMDWMVQFDQLAEPVPAQQ